jgi:hypothetical protein
MVLDLYFCREIHDVISCDLKNALTSCAAPLRGQSLVHGLYACRALEPSPLLRTVWSVGSLAYELPLPGVSPDVSIAPSPIEAREGCKTQPSAYCN